MRELCEDRAPDTECSLKRHVLSRRLNHEMQSGAQVPPRLRDCCLSGISAKLTLRSPGGILFFFLFAGNVWACCFYESFSLPLSSQDVYLPHTLACILATAFTWAAVAAGRGRATPAQALTAPGEPAQSRIRGSVAGPSPLRVSLPFPPGGSGPAHRKWLSTVSFFASLESPVMNRVRLTCRRNTPGRKVTRASQSARGTHPVQASSRKTMGTQRLRCLPS